MKTYEILKDTNIIENNTADALQVKISEETPITEFVSVDGIIKGDNLTKTKISYVNLGNLKTRKLQIDQTIELFQKESQEIEEIISELTPKIDEAIGEILKDPKVEDRRVDTTSETIPTV